MDVPDFSLARNLLHHHDIAVHLRGHLPLQHHLQILDFVSVFPQKGIFGVLVDDWLVFNEFCTAGVSEGTEGFLVVVAGWGDCCDHDCFRVAAQGVLKQSGQFGISVGNVMGLPIYQCRYHITKSTQGQVDFSCLFHPIANRVGLRLPLRTSQIH